MFGHIECIVIIFWKIIIEKFIDSKKCTENLKYKIISIIMRHLMYR